MHGQPYVKLNTRLAPWFKGDELGGTWDQRILTWYMQLGLYQTKKEKSLEHEPKQQWYIIETKQENVEERKRGASRLVNYLQQGKLNPLYNWNEDFWNKESDEIQPILLIVGLKWSNVAPRPPNVVELKQKFELIMHA